MTGSPSEPDLPELQILLPVESSGSSIGPDREEKKLGELYAYPVSASSSTGYVRANMVSSLDGAAWGVNQLSGSINNPADFRAFRVQRALADVVLIGAGTVRAEGYTPLSVPEGLEGLRARSGASANIELAVVTRSGQLPDSIFDADRMPLVITSASRAHALPSGIPQDKTIIAGDDDVDLAQAVTELAARGLPRILTEGGPHLLGSALSAGIVDELALTISPLIVGLDSGRIVAGFSPPDTLLARPAHLLHYDGVLLGRWILRA